MAKKNKKHPNFQDIFSLEDIEIARDVMSTYDCGKSRIALCAPDQTYCINTRLFKEPESASCLVNCTTLKLRYAEEVWYNAVLISKCNPGDMLYYWWLNWEEDDTSFRKLAYSNFNRNITVEQLLADFWKLLEELSNSGKIKVSEGYHLYSTVTDLWHSEPIIKCNVFINSDSGKDIIKKVGNIFEYPYNETLISFSWDDIKELFVELTLDQLRLTMPEHLHKHHAIDDMLFTACDNYDYELMKALIDRGANVNALNKNGESPLQRVIEDSLLIYDEEKLSDEEIANIERTKLDQCEKCADLLLDNGADIDLFGYDGMQPLACAYYNHNLELANFLLNKGADPNYNSYLTDCQYWSRLKNVRCTVLDIIDDDLCEEYDDTEKAIEKAVREHGGRQFKWDYDPYSYTNHSKYYICMSPGNNYLFFDNANWGIGDSKYVRIEHEDGTEEKIDISKVEGLSEWQSEYLSAKENKQDLSLLDKRGYALAQNVNRILPKDAALFYCKHSETKPVKVIS